MCLYGVLKVDTAFSRAATVISDAFQIPPYNNILGSLRLAFKDALFPPVWFAAPASVFRHEQSAARSAAVVCSSSSPASKFSDGFFFFSASFDRSLVLLHVLLTTPPRCVNKYFFRVVSCKKTNKNVLI